MSYLGIGPETIAQRIETVVKGADTPEDKLRASLEIERLITALGVLKSELDQSIHATYGAGSMRVADRSTGEVRTAKITESRTTRTDADKLRSAILTRIGDRKEIIFDESGDPKPPSQIAISAAEFAFLLAGAGTPGYTGWRKTPLKDLGIKVSDYETSEISGVKVSGRS
jgi:hypothetical protein